MLGTAFGQAGPRLLPGADRAAGAYALVGMGAVFAGAARAPITAVLIIFELTGDYSIILPLMVAIVLAHRRQPTGSPPTRSTRSSCAGAGSASTARASSSVMRTVPVSAAMGPLPRPLASGASLEEVLARLVEGSDDTLPVLDVDGAVAGVLSAADVETAARAGDARDAAALLPSGPWPRLRTDDSLEEAGRALSVARVAGLPVLAAGSLQPVGWVTHRDILRTYHDERGRLTAAKANPVLPVPEATGRRQEVPAPPELSSA